MKSYTKKTILRYLKEIDRKNKIIKQMLENETPAAESDTESGATLSDPESEILDPMPRKKLLINRRRN